MQVKIKAFLSRHFFPILVLIGLLILRFGPLLLGKVFFFGDDFYLMVPGKLFTVEWLRKGIVPFWNPYVLGGISWIGDINQSIWYFSTLLFAIFPPAIALSLNQAIHVVIGFLGAFLLGRRWGLRQTASTLLAVIWTTGMNVTGGYNNISILQSLVWIPWVIESVLLIAERLEVKSVIRLAIVIAFFIFAGYPQFLVYAELGGIALVLWKYRLWKRSLWGRGIRFISFMMIASLVSLCLTAIAILPFLEALKTSTRMIQSEKQSTMGSVQPIEMLKILHPSLFDNFAEGMRWGPIQSADPNLIFYVGWVGLILIIFQFFRSPRKRDFFFAGIIGFSLLFSLGSHLPGYAFIQKILPVFRFSRGPGSIFLLITLFAGLWLGSLLQESKLFSKKLAKRLAILFSLIVVISIVALFVTHSHFSESWKFFDDVMKGKLSNSPFHTVLRDQVISRVVFTQLLVSAISAIVSCVLLARKKMRWFVVVVLIDIWFATKMLYVYAPATVYDFSPNKVLVQTLQDSQSRVLTSNYNVPYADFGTYYTAIAARSPFTDSYVDRAELQSFSVAKRMQETLTPDWGNVAGIQSLHGYVTLMPQSANSFWNRTADPSINNLPYVALSDPRLKEWSIGYYLVDSWFPNVASPSSQPILTGDTSKGELWSLYKLNALPRFRYGDGSPILTQSLKEDPNNIRFRAEVPNDKNNMIVADRWEKGWKAFVDGKEISLLPTESGLRTFPVSRGDHEVHLQYSPMPFWLGLAISLSSWLLTLIAWIFFSLRGILRDK